MRTGINEATFLHAENTVFVFFCKCALVADRPWNQVNNDGFFTGALP